MYVPVYAKCSIHVLSVYVQEQEYVPTLSAPGYVSCTLYRLYVPGHVCTSTL